MAIAIMHMNEKEASYSAFIACNSPLGKRYGFEQEVLTKKLIDAIYHENILLVAKKNETVVGFAWIDPKGCFSSAPYLRLIAVDEHCRGQNVGSLLLEAFETQTQYVGRDFILLVSDFNEQAIHFYEKNGYTKRGELPDFVIHGVKEIMMVKREKKMSFDSITHEMIETHSFTTSHIRIEKWGELLYDSFFSSDISVPFPLFDIASLTKIFTTTAILHLISQGAIDENTTIKTLFPTYPSSLHHITIDSLLTHTSGLLGWYPFYTQRDTPFEEILPQVVKKNPLENKMIYSDINFMICGKIIEHVLSLPLDEAMQNIVFNPLSLHQTTYHPDKSRSIPTEFGNRIESEMVKERNLQFNQFRPTNKAIIGECNDGNAYYYFKGVAGHAGIFSSAEDINKLISLYLHSNDPSYIHPHLIEKAITDQGNQRGYGFQMGGNYPHGGLGHTGFTGTYLYLNPKKGFTISILTNRLNVAHPGNIQSYRNAIVDEAFFLYL